MSHSAGATLFCVAGIFCLCASPSPESQTLISFQPLPHSEAAKYRLGSDPLGKSLHGPKSLRGLASQPVSFYIATRAELNY